MIGEMNGFSQLAEEIKYDQQILDAKYTVLINKFQAIITDKSIPLKDRWDFWIGSDSKLKYGNDNVPDGIMGDFAGADECPTMYERGDDVYWCNLLSTVWNQDTGELMDIYGEDYPLDRLIELLETILDSNEESFTWDW